MLTALQFEIKQQGFVTAEVPLHIFPDLRTPGCLAAELQLLWLCSPWYFKTQLLFFFPHNKYINEWFSSASQRTASTSTKKKKRLTSFGTLSWIFLLYILDIRKGDRLKKQSFSITWSISYHIMGMNREDWSLARKNWTSVKKLAAASNLVCSKKQLWLKVRIYFFKESALHVDKSLST